MRGSKVTKAITKARETQKDFYKRLEERGKEVLDNLGKDEIALVIISRPYNGCDSGVNLDLPEKLKGYGHTGNTDGLYTDGFRRYIKGLSKYVLEIWTKDTCRGEVYSKR